MISAKSYLSIIAILGMLTVSLSAAAGVEEKYILSRQLVTLYKAYLRFYLESHDLWKDKTIAGYKASETYLTPEQLQVKLQADEKPILSQISPVVQAMLPKDLPVDFYSSPLGQELVRAENGALLEMLKVLSRNSWLGDQKPKKNNPSPLQIRVFYLLGNHSVSAAHISQTLEQLKINLPEPSRNYLIRLARNTQMNYLSTHLNDKKAEEISLFLQQEKNKTYLEKRVAFSVWLLNFLYKSTRR